MGHHPDALSARVVDPEVDFDGCIEQIAKLVIDQLVREIPAGLPAKEQARRLVIRAAERLVRGLKHDDWPPVLIENEMRHLVNVIGHYSTLHES